jgi:crotonobetainyl-CoA hydratase
MEGIRADRRGQVFEVTIDRPKANAIDAATSRELGQAFWSFHEDPDLRVAIVTGAGDRFFSAGWDLKAAAAGDTEEYGKGGFGGLTELFGLTKPVIAAVNGWAAGGGLEIALACDLILASRDARLALPEVTRGLVPDAGGMLRLPKRIPRALAMEMMLTGRAVEADEAERWGLVNQVVAPAELMDEARAMADRIVAAAPLAVEAVKAIVGATEEVSVEQGYAILRSGAIPHYELSNESEDAKEGPRAFAEGRDPEWKGR